MIWIVGRKGMLGRIVEQELETANEPFVACGSECDVTNEESIRSCAPRMAPDWVINCTGYTAVDRAEREPRAAWAVNRTAAGHLARYCRSVEAAMVHISTDYVFDGSRKRGYDETATTAPLNVYGASKEAGERLLRSLVDAHVIIRSAWLYAETGRNFLLNVLHKLHDETELTIVNDQHGTPTYARDLARAIIAVVTSPKIEYGTFHFVNAGTTTWYEFACEIQEMALHRGLTSMRRTIHPVTSNRYVTLATRPLHSVLRFERIERAYDIAPRPWREALRDCMARIPVTRSAEPPYLDVVNR